MDQNQRLMDREIEQELSDAYMRHPSEEGYSAGTERLGKLYKLRSDEVLAEKELALKERELNLKEEELALKEKQAKDAEKQSWLRTGVEFVAAAAPPIFFAYWMNKGFRFEETGTITSQTFRGLISKFRPFK